MIPRKRIRCCRRVGDHHSLLDILIRANRRHTKREHKTRSINSLAALTFLDYFSLKFSVISSFKSQWSIIKDDWDFICRHNRCCCTINSTKAKYALSPGRGNVDKNSFHKWINFIKFLNYVIYINILQILKCTELFRMYI